jgi:Flp pilus assembly protein TadD
VHNPCEKSRFAAGGERLSQRYTQREVGRILGLEPGRLRYWERLRLVRPQSRWGERFYSFGDLVALRTIKRLTDNRIPARRVRRALQIIEKQFGATPLPLQELHFIEQGRDLLVIPPRTSRPFSPIKQQWAFAFSAAVAPAKVHPMTGRTPEELFQTALSYEAREATLPEAIESYKQVLSLAPDWIEAHINLGVAFYQMGKTTEAGKEFLAAVQLDPSNGISRYNLGCVLEEEGRIEEAIKHLRRAARAMPTHPDVHFNLALAYERRNQRRLARGQWMLYLRYAPTGPWADQARARLKQHSIRRKPPAPIPFPRKA